MLKTVTFIIICLSAISNILPQSTSLAIFYFQRACSTTLQHVGWDLVTHLQLQQHFHGGSTT
jgi:hypothetical protein